MFLQITPLHIQMWSQLRDVHLKKPNENTWKDVSAKFKNKANFPNRIGAVDGKHIHITHPPNTGSLYWNYKHFNSIVLLALCDAEYLFLYVDIGAYGKSSNSTIWKNCNLHKLLDKNELDIATQYPANS